MKKTVLVSVFLTFILLISPALQAETHGEDPSSETEVKGTAYDQNALTVLPGSPKLDSVRGTSASVSHVGTYDELLTAIRKAKAGSQARVEKAVEQERVREAWEIGRLIDEHVLQHKERADYAEQVISRLSSDLGLSDRELYYNLRFYRLYPILPHASKLSWSEYRELLSVNDAKERDALAEKAEKEKWTRDQMREEVKAVTQKEKPAETKPEETLKPSPLGQPGTYKIILAKTGPYEGELALDLGFSIYFRLSEVAEDLSEFKEGELVLFEEKEIQLLGKPRAADLENLLYTYNARVFRVLDGDTVEAVVDLGFGITTTQTLRLRGIDCPELVSKEGKEAKAFVEKLLEGTGSPAESGVPVPMVLIKTSKSDKYDRYLADVFITDKTGDVQYLNNELLEKGLAVRVNE